MKGTCYGAFTLREEGAKEEIDLVPALKGYYTRHMADGTFVSWLALDEENIIGTSGMSFVEKSPYFGCPSGKIGLISSMFTDPKYRRMDIYKGRFVNYKIGNYRRNNMTVDKVKTTHYYEELSIDSLCDCDYCRLYYSKSKAVYPELTDWLMQYGIDIEKPYETMVNAK